jgi:hypothetical protein
MGHASIRATRIQALNRIVGCDIDPNRKVIA